MKIYLQKLLNLSTSIMRILKPINLFGAGDTEK